MTGAAFEDVPLVVEPGYGGWRLDRYLQHRLRGWSRTQVQRLIAAGIEGNRTLKASSRVVAGECLHLRRPVLNEPETPIQFDVLHLDDELLVVDKPAGLPVHATARYRKGTLVQLVRARFGDNFAAPAHRLDRETSGVLVLGRGEATQTRLMRALRARQVHKEYVAIVHGWPSDNAFAVDAPLALGGKTVRLAVRVDAVLGRPSRTRFVVVQRFMYGQQPLAELRCFPETGRQHQIRAHLRHAGYPLVGDKIYGASEDIYDRFTRGMLSEADQLALILPRHALHAAAIELQHPATGQPIRFAAPLPDDLATLRNAAKA